MIKKNLLDLKMFLIFHPIVVDFFKLKTINIHLQYQRVTKIIKMHLLVFQNDPTGLILLDWI